MKKKCSTNIEGPSVDFTMLLDTIGNSVYTLKPGAKKILDVGCGCGLLAERLIEIYPESDFTMLDIQERMLMKSKAKTEGLTRNPISFVESDMRIAKFPARSFDLIAALMSVHFMTDRDEYLMSFRNFRKWLSPRGVFVAGGFVGEASPAIREMQLTEWCENQDETERQRYPQAMLSREMEFVAKILPVAEQIEMLKAAGFQEVGLLYKKFHFGAYYAIK